MLVSSTVPSDLSIPHLRLEHAGVFNRSIRFINTRFKIFFKKDQTETTKSSILLKCIMANTSAIWQYAAHDYIYHLLVPDQEPYKTAHLVTFRRMDHQQQKDKTERATAREGPGKGNHLIARRGSKRKGDLHSDKLKECAIYHN